MKWIVRYLNRALWLDVENWLTGQLNTNSPSRHGLIIRSGLPRVGRRRTWSTCSVWAWYEVGMECLSGLSGGVVHPGAPGSPGMAADAPQTAMTQQAVVGLTEVHCAVQLHMNFGFRQRFHKYNSHLLEDNCPTQIELTTLPGSQPGFWVIHARSRDNNWTLLLVMEKASHKVHIARHGSPVQYDHSFMTELA